MERLLDDHLPLSRTGIDRDYERRADLRLFETLWGDPRTRVLPYIEDRVPVLFDEQRRPYLLLLPADAVPEHRFRAYLGRSVAADVSEPRDTPLVWCELAEGDQGALPVAGAEWLTLRQIGSQLNARDAGMLTEAQALSHWHNSHGYCPKCGVPTVIEEAGWLRRCTEDGYEVFPRTDPAVIVAVLDQHDRILLGSHGNPGNRFSVLAGFVEAGESLQAAIVREMFEETGLVVKVEDYLGSQPWPFPQSLMVAFSARVVSGPDEAHTPQPDGIEITELRWFDREHFAREARRLILPGFPSIARAMIESWYGAEVSDSTSVSVDADPVQSRA